MSTRSICNNQQLVFALILCICYVDLSVCFSPQTLLLRHSTFRSSQTTSQQRGVHLGASHRDELSKLFQISGTSPRRLRVGPLGSQQGAAEDVKQETKIERVDRITQPLVTQGRDSRLRFGWAMASGAVGATAVLLGISDVPLAFLLSIYVVLALGIQGGVLALSLGIMQLVSTYKKLQIQIFGKKMDS